MLTWEDEKHVKKGKKNVCFVFTRSVKTKHIKKTTQISISKKIRYFILPIYELIV
jgi:hypothetical protein